jgi:hypothetical protein
MHTNLNISLNAPLQKIIFLFYQLFVVSTLKEAVPILKKYYFIFSLLKITLKITFVHFDLRWLGPRADFR